MPHIRPISDLRNHSLEISKLCHNENQPVFITKNGKGDLVIMSLSHYEDLQNLLALYRRLGEAEVLDQAGEQGITHHEMMERLRSQIQ